MNLFDFPKKKFDEEITQILLDSDNIRIEKILSDGQTSDWYDQEEAEWVALLKGEAELEFEDRRVKLQKGDSLLIAPHEKHRVAKTGRCIWLCVFFEKAPKYYTYILSCADGSLYCGYTNNLDKRIRKHNAGKGAKYTKSRLPVKLVYSEEFSTKSEAMRREYEIKRLPRDKKTELIKKVTDFGSD